MQVDIVRARIEDVPQMHRLINEFANRGDMLPRALSQIYENIRDYVVARDGDHVIGCAALHVNWLDLAEIRSLAVDQSRQQEGLGGALVQACVDEARALGLPRVFCLTRQPEFFARLGFVSVDKSQLPHKIWAECYYCPKFPDCDEFALIRDVPGDSEPLLRKAGVKDWRQHNGTTDLKRTGLQRSRHLTTSGHGEEGKWQDSDPGCSGAWRLRGGSACGRER